MNRFDRERFDAMGKEALARVEEIMNTTKLNELIHKREEDEKKKNCILWILAIIGAVAAVLRLPMRCTVSSPRTIWRTSRTTLTMTLTTTSLTMRSRKRRKSQRTRRKRRRQKKKQNNV